MKRKTTLLAMVITCLPFTMASAAGISNVQLHGFITAGANITDESTEYSGGVTDDVGFSDSRFGLNVTTSITEDWNVAGQLIAKNRDNDDFNLEVDWAFAAFTPSDMTTLRFGRIKYPVGLVTEFIETGYAYLWIRPPENFYNLDSTGPNFLRKSLDGANAAWQLSTDSTDYSLDVYGGIAQVDDGRMKNFYGARIGAEVEDVFRIQASVNTGEMDVDNSEGRMMMMDGADHTTVTLGVSMDWNDFILLSEVGIVRMGKSDTTLLTSAQKSAVSDSMDATSWYATLGYRIGKATPHVTYSDWDQDSGLGQKTLTAGIRYELASSVALKVEWQRIDASTRSSSSISFLPPAAFQNAGLFDGDPDGDVNLFSATLDFIF